MSLAGLLSVITDDPQFRQVVQSGRGGLRRRLPGRRRGRHRAIRAPSAASRGPDRPARDRQPVPARGHRDRQGSRGTGRGTRFPAAPGRCGLLPAHGRRSRTNGSHPARTPPASAWRCCAGSPTPIPPVPVLPRSPLWSLRCAPCSSRSSEAWPTWSRSRWPKVTPATWTRCWPGLSTSGTCGRIWWSAAVRWRSAVASSMSSRPRRSTRCGSNCSATSSRRPGSSGWPTSAAWGRPQACGRRPAASCC